MFFQNEVLRKAATLVRGGTYRLDLPEHGLLSSLLLFVYGDETSNYGIDGGDWRIVEKVSKIEIIAEGSRVIKSYPGDVCQPLGIFDQGVFPPSVWRNYASNSQVEVFIINFGRELYDKELALDLARFKNVELRITLTTTTSDFSTLYMTTHGIFLRDIGAAMGGGYMRSEVWREWTTVIDETKYLDLPIEYPIRRVLIQAIPAVDGTTKVDKQNYHAVIEDIELFLDTGQVTMYNGNNEDLARENFFAYKRDNISVGSSLLHADKGHRKGLGYTLGGAWGAGSQDGAVATTFPTLEWHHSRDTLKLESAVTDGPIGWIFRGMAPYNCTVLRFDHDPSPGSWLDPRTRASVLLNLHTRNAASAVGGTARVILDRLVRY